MALFPVQLSATSQAVAPARHSVPADLKRHEKVQQELLLPFAAPWSHASPESTTPLPQSVVEVAHTSCPRLPSSARKNTKEPATVNPEGLELLLLGARSSTRVVPASVPSLCHSSYPLI